MIVSGAEARGIRVGTSGAYQLDAYEPLKLVARRANGPICGNRVWSTNGKVVVERERGNPASDHEVFSYTGSSSSIVNVLHGGRTMRNDLGDSNSWEELRYLPELRTWRNYAIDWDLPQPGRDGGTYSSARGTSNHDGDAVIWTYPTLDDGLELRLRRAIPATGGWNESFLARIFPSSLTTAHAFTRDSVSALQTPDGDVPGGYEFVSENSTVAVAFAPRGDRAFVAVTQYRTTPSARFWGDWVTYDDGTSYRMLDSVVMAFRRDGPTKILEVSVPDGAMRLLGTIDASVNSIAASESSDELVLTEYDEVSSTMVMFPNTRVSHPYSGGIVYRRLAYRTLERSGGQWVLAPEAARIIPLPAGNVRDGQMPGSVAPLRMADATARTRLTRENLARALRARAMRARTSRSASQGAQAREQSHASLP